MIIGYLCVSEIVMSFPNFKTRILMCIAFAYVKAGPTAVETTVSHRVIEALQRCVHHGEHWGATSGSFV